MRGCRQALQFLCHACGEFSPSCPALESHSDEFAVLQRMEELLEKLRYFAGDPDMGPSERPPVRKAVRVSLGYDAQSPDRRAPTRSTFHLPGLLLPSPLQIGKAAGRETVCP